jgi:phosphatidate cytidylyltransferase
MAGPDIGKRLAVAGVGIPAGLALIYVGGWPLGAVLTIIAILGAREFYGIAEAGGAQPFARIGAISSGALVLFATQYPRIEALALMGWGVVLGVGLLSLALSVFGRWPDGKPLASSSSTVLGILYTGGTVAFVPLLWNLPELGGGAGPLGSWAGPALVLFPIVVTWFGDSGAYFAGYRFGKTKLIPAVSPGKTVAGSVGGFVASALAGGLLGGLVLDQIPVFGIGAIEGALLGIVLGGVAQVADLAESVLKREAGVKDSSNLLPGHGGILDRFDSIYFSVPLTFAFLVVRAALL